MTGDPMRTAISLITGLLVLTAPTVARVQPLDDCLLVGDSTIVGTAPALQRKLGTVCRVQAKTGVGSAEILTWPSVGSYRLALIGAGSNDPRNPQLQGNLARLRAGIRAVRVVWLKPYDAQAAQTVDAVAARHGDMTVSLASFPSTDRLHPASYSAVARQIAAQPLFGPTAVPLSRAAQPAPASPLPAARHAEIISASLN